MTVQLQGSLGYSREKEHHIYNLYVHDFFFVFFLSHTKTNTKPRRKNNIKTQLFLFSFTIQCSCCETGLKKIKLFLYRQLQHTMQLIANALEGISPVFLFFHLFLFNSFTATHHQLFLLLLFLFHPHTHTQNSRSFKKKYTR